MTPELATTHIRLAVADCLREHDPAKRNLDRILARLWREPPEVVIEAFRAAVATYDAVVCGKLDDGGGVGLRAARMRDLRRPLPKRDKPGLPLPEVAKRLGMDRETMARLMERHGLLEMVPFGGRQSRRLVTDQAFREGLGHNADPGNTRSPRLDGHARAMVFPVFYPDALPLVAERLGWGGIQDAARSIPDKRERLRWLLDNYGDLPNDTLGDLAGCSGRWVKKVRVVKAGGEGAVGLT